MMAGKAIVLAGLMVAAGLAVGLTACTGNPFQKEEPFVATAVPADFAVVVDENHDTHYARQHIKQTINAAEGTSRTEYTTFRDYNNTVSNKFSQETPLSPVQLQNMWNEVSQHRLLNRSTIWLNWASDADIYKRNTYTLQIRANGQTKTYRNTNGFAGPQRPLMLQVEAVRLPMSVNSRTPVVPGRREQPAASQPEMPAETMPAATGPAAIWGSGNDLVPMDAATTRPRQ